MHTDQLNYFLTIVDSGSFTEASFQLSVSQSSLSKQISKLEDELNTRLFHRGKRQLTLTDDGERFLVYAREAWAQYCKIVSELSDDKARGGLLHIASIDHLGRVGLTTPISTFIESFPEGKLKISIEKSHATQVVEWLLSGKCEICFTAQITDTRNGISNLDCYDLKDYDCRTLLRDKYYAIVPNSHPLTSRQEITWPELGNESLLLLDKSNSLNHMVRDIFASFNIAPHITFECGQTDTLLGMVANGLGITLLSGHIAEKEYGVRLIPIAEPLTRDTVMIVPKGLLKKRGLVYQFAKHITDYYYK